MAPSTFASAAAGNPQRDAAANDWNRRTNGATQTFRRPSGATTTTPTAAQPLDSLPASLPPRYVPPHRNGTLPDTRYSKDQLLDLYKAQQSTDGGLSDGLPDLFVGGWQPEVMNGTSSGWARSEHTRDTQPGTEICWERDDVAPLGLIEMDDEERELFLNSVNTPMKPISTNKENQQPNGLPGRKVSVSSITTPGGFGLPSPNVARGAGRRRETSESFPFPQNNVSSPGGFARDEPRAASPPPSLLRRRTDFKDLGKTDDKESDDKQTSSPFGTLKRHQTGPLSAGFNAPSSPWSTGPQSAGLTPMGSFGNFSTSGTAAPQNAPGEKRPGLGSGRSESRFKNLLNKDSNEDISQRPIERKGSISGLGRVNEHESWRAQDPGNEPLDEADEDLPTGSAALAADTDISPPHPRQGFRGFGTPSRQGTQQDDFGFAAFGMTSDNTHTFGQGLPTGRDTSHQTPAQQRIGLQIGGNEPMSPTDTNPYQSPEQHGVDRMTEDNGDGTNDLHSARLPGLGQFGGDPSQQLGGLSGLGALPNLGRGPQGPASDRSQTSSVGPGRGFPGLGGLGQLGGGPGSSAWPVTQGGLGTPSRQAGLSNAFGGGVFSNHMSDLQSPSLAGLGGPNLMNPQGGTFGGSRMASMFPQAMQDQIQQSDHDGGNERSAQGFQGLGDIGRSNETPFNSQAFGQDSKGLESSEHQQHQFGAPGQQAEGQVQNPPPGSSASNQPPAPQQRTMVMPDRMRWIYRDPQGQTQGPWTGLEMHDWYKAGFFSPELLVKKFEDPDYEPLAQLIRRIGNSREPFLVPQIGIPHGPAAATGGPTAWTGSAAVGNTGAQPPFASSFPSFGTTLTAEQQNALERRKQEEQYLMARQKEHLAQAQIAQRQQLLSGGHNLTSGQLHHHSSAHSLQSQPSFGSITSPSAYQPSPIQGPTGGVAGAPPPPSQGFFDNSFRSPQQAGLGAVGAGADSLGRIRGEEIPNILDRLSLSGGRGAAGQFGAPGQPLGAGQQQDQGAHERQVQQMLEDRARLQQEQAEHDAQQQAQEEEQPISNERLQQLQQLQSDHEAIAAAEQREAEEQEFIARAPESRRPQEPLSLTEQVQKAASAKQSPAPQQPGLPQPFPPAPSQSPLPAPAAQRAGRQSVADQLQTESRDLSQTPSVDTPSAAVAPWAKEPAEALKGPSLKEIQEAEAKKAAEAEVLAAAARRAAFEKEMQAQAQAAAPQPGLPTSSTWGAPSPATPTGSAPAAWAKTAQKPVGPSSSKTLAQIQKEEEARKKKQAAAVASAQTQAAILSGVPAPAVGKSYANLAGKISSPVANPSMAGGAWTTVGAGGKAKTPTTGPPPSTSRTVSAGVVPTLQPATVRKPAVRSSTMAGASAVNAQEEFRKWAVNELRPDLSKGINADEFVATLLVFPAETDMITEAVHGVSSTIDSRHFAEEFVRRKRLADKGLIEPKSTSSPLQAADKNGGGWSQVAKKGPAKEEPAEVANGNFRMVASKKKGGKR